MKKEVEKLRGELFDALTENERLGRELADARRSADALEEALAFLLERLDRLLKQDQVILKLLDTSHRSIEELKKIHREAAGQIGSTALEQRKEEN